jgi:hypothetical protein
MILFKTFGIHGEDGNGNSHRRFEIIASMDKFRHSCMYCKLVQSGKAFQAVHRR